jgi:hypothetical protein
MEATIPLTGKGEKILGSMEETYGSEKKAKSVLYASKNKGNITGIDQMGTLASFAAREVGETIGSESWTGLTGGGSSGSGLRMASTIIAPESPVSTQTQAQENIGMGRPANAGPFSATGAPPTDRMGARQMPRAKDNAEGPKGVTHPLGGDFPEESIKTESSSGPSGIPDAWSPEAREAAAEARKAKSSGGSSISSPKNNTEKNLMSAAHNTKNPNLVRSMGRMENSGYGERLAKHMESGGATHDPWAGKFPKEAPLDAAGRRKLAQDRPPDKAVGTTRDYAAAAGAKR